jgi:hypothetical protein
MLPLIGRPHSIREGVMHRQWSSELIPFSNAVQGVHTKITGASLSPFVGPGIDAVLNEVAHAMADLVTIYGAPNDQVPIKPLPWVEVKLGLFQRAATVVRTSDGIEYRRLYIRRGDVLAAATVLKKSGARFPSIETTLAASEASIGPATRGETEAQSLGDWLK